jgi:hypothetical protein
MLSDYRKQFAEELLAYIHVGAPFQSKAAVASK